MRANYLNVGFIQIESDIAVISSHAQHEIVPLLKLKSGTISIEYNNYWGIIQ